MGQKLPENMDISDIASVESKIKALKKQIADQRNKHKRASKALEKRKKLILAEVFEKAITDGFIKQTDVDAWIKRYCSESEKDVLNQSIETEGSKPKAKKQKTEKQSRLEPQNSQQTEQKSKDFSSNAKPLTAFRRTQ